MIGKTGKSVCIAAACIISLYLVLHVTGIGCPVRFMTGISCAGCGMTRAWLSLLQLDIRGAFSFHPLFFLPPVLLMLLAVKKRIREGVYRRLMLTVLMLVFIIYLGRLLDTGDAVVVFDPGSGAILKTAGLLWKGG